MAKPETADAVDTIVGQWRRELPELDVDPMEVFGRIHRTSALTSRKLRTVFNAHGITNSEFDVLASLRRSAKPFELSPKQISAALMLTSGGLTARLDKLERAGFVERLPDPNDRRGLRIRLTTAGRQAVEGAVADEVVLLRQVLDSALSPAETRTLGRLLGKLHGAYAGEAID